MGIVNTLNINQEIKALTFTADGSMACTLGTTGDVSLPDKTVQIGLADTSDILDKATTSGMTIRQAIVVGVYQHLIASGAVAGTMSV
jgi:hypothetical protein